MVSRSAICGAVCVRAAVKQVQGRQPAAATGSVRCKLRRDSALLAHPIATSMLLEEFRTESGTQAYVRSGQPPGAYDKNSGQRLLGGCRGSSAPGARDTLSKRAPSSTTFLKVMLTPLARRTCRACAHLVHYLPVRPQQPARQQVNVRPAAERYGMK
jgi:hypothetical protein